MTQKRYYSHGKLLITGEYLVVKGTLALAVPTKIGQALEVTMKKGDYKTGRWGEVHWQSFYNDECWFEAEFSLPAMEIVSSKDKQTASYLQKLLREALEMNKGHFTEGQSYHIKTSMDFSPEWGLGSSSSLINNIASWFNINPYALLGKMHKGSAYDIACASASSPIWYRRVLGSPVSQNIIFNPPFKDHLCFVYSGKKQDSESSVSNFLEKIKADPSDKERITAISRDIAVVKNQEAFNALLDEHERIMSRMLGIPAIKGSRFPDFPGSIKSLGAWGGDFLLASASVDIEEIKAYFSRNGLDLSFSWDEIVLSD